MLIMFMDASIWWDLNVSLSEQETSAMLILFRDAAIGWVLDVSLSEKQTCSVYIFSNNVYSHCSLVGTRCQPF
jgi:hypothetical protein